MDLLSNLGCLLMGAGITFLVEEWRWRRDRRRDDIAKYIRILAPVRAAAVRLVEWYDVPHLPADLSYREPAGDLLDAMDLATAEIGSRFGSDGARSDRIHQALIRYGTVADEPGHDRREARRLAEDVLFAVTTAPW